MQCTGDHQYYVELRGAALKELRTASIGARDRIEIVLMRRLGVDSLYRIVQSMSLVLGAYIN